MKNVLLFLNLFPGSTLLLWFDCLFRQEGFFSPGFGDLSNLVISDRSALSPIFVWSSTETHRTTENDPGRYWALKCLSEHPLF